MLGYYLMPHPPIVVPEVGKGREEEVINTLNAFKEAGKRVADLGTETIIIITPHGTVFRDAVSIITSESISGDLSQFAAGSVKFNYQINTALVKAIINKARKYQVPVAELNEESAGLYGIDISLDHGVMVPLYFLEKYRKYKLVHLTYGMISPLDLVRFGKAIKDAVEETGSKAVFIASGDLSHRLTEDGPYPYTPLGQEFDKELVSILESGEMTKIFSLDNHLVNEAAECGLRSLYVLAGAINKSKVATELINYEGPLGVGYAVMEFKDEGVGEDLYLKLVRGKIEENERRMNEGNPYTVLARKNLNKYYDDGTILDLKDVSDKSLLNERKGVFVSLKINGELRGCIGTIEPVTDSVAEEIIKNSLSAALKDPRFSPVTKEELLEIDISVDLLSEPEDTDFNGLDPKEYGVIVSSGRKRGLLLPNLEGVDTKEKQVEIAREKAGIDIGGDYTLQRFKVERFKEVEDNE